jgi:TonB family protein
MGYQALLFCPDEKLARIVAQVFSDLEFNVEPVQEPFSAVKKLMAQRFDALVVDCENESNASLLFKSARNSSTNQGTLAIAVVEGQAGVAKAYRIGANLVLTKPINVEQAKGTLRVARGLLRKNAEAVPAPAHPVAPAAPRAEQAPEAKTALVAPASIPASIKPAAAPAAPAKVARELPEFEPVTPAIAASAAETPVAAAPVEQAPATKAVPAEIPVPVVTAPTEAKPAATPAPASTTSVGAAQGAATAPAKVKESVPPEFEPPSAPFEPQAYEAVGSTPSFSALDLEDSGSKSGKQKILIAAVVVLAVAALGYFGWTKTSSHKPATPAAHPVSAPPQPSSPAPAPTPTSAPSNTAPAAATDSANLTVEPAASKPTASLEPSQTVSQPVQTVSQPTIRLQIAPDAGGKVAAAAPLKVKSGIEKNTKTTAEDSSAPLPSTLAVADANSNALNSVVAAPTAPARPSLATLKISQGVSQGLLIKRVDPKYPASALAMHVQGAVLLDATINREGMISNLTVVKGDKVLARAATDAVKQWRYKPYYLDGEPVEIQTQITINFKLPN